MYESQMSDQLVMRWIPVVDPSGRTHMESCWISAAQAAPAPAVQIHHAA
ncbi:hypothetical protein [Nocardioides lijunqiniae]|nr:hypothetical protein [Nocardioides lijunqiniae]